jgi:prepilin-type processing-associated H-X9-DG protein
MKDFLIDGKVPILFVDGHVETISPKDYMARKLDDLPRK